MATSALPRHSHLSHSEDVVHALEERGLLDPARHHEAADVLDDLTAGRPRRTTTLRRVLAEVAGYVGAAFVVAAVAVFVAPRWLDLSLGTRVGLLVGAAAVLVAAGLALGITGGGLRSLRTAGGALRRRLVSVALTGASVAGAAAVTVLLTDWADSGAPSRDVWIGIGGFATLAVLAAIGYVVAPTLLGQAAVAVGATLSSVSVWETVDAATSAHVAATVMLLGVGWLVLAEARVWREQLPARLIGAALVVGGAQVLLAEYASWAYVLTAAAGVAGFVLYAVRHAWPYLAMGVVAVTLAVPEALLDWTTGSLGTAAALLAAGVTLLIASLVGLRLRRQEPAD
jgi:MFS family permease